MAPKRKRPVGSHQPSDGNGTSPRPSPHRPGNLSLAQHNQTHGGGRGGRRPSARHNGRASNGGSAPMSPATATATAPSDAELNALSSSVSAQHTALTSAHANSGVKSSQSTTFQPDIPAEPAWPTTLPLSYQWLTDDRLSRWSIGGKQEVLAEALRQIQEHEILDLSDILQETIRSVMTERINANDAGVLLNEVIQHDSDPEGDTSVSRHFIDCFATLTEPGNSNPSRLREFLEATGISSALLREHLDAPLLIQLGLVRSTFTQMGTRYSTNVLYKLPTYNLLREDTEGYSKLISEYYSCAERGQPTADLVSDTFQKVKALIGAFNLDSGRSLDITLDVFGDLLIKRHRFFVRYLRASSFWPQKQNIEGIQPDNSGFSSLPWWTDLTYQGGHIITEEDKGRLVMLKQVRDVQFWDRARQIGIRAFFELGGRRLLDHDDRDHASVAKPVIEHDDVLEWISETKTYPPTGNKMAAQLLGYKLRYYASDIRGDSQLPENLIWLAALLIHIGFISLKDLYPHLYPADEQMKQVESIMQKEKEAREIKKRPGGGENPLTRAKPLTDDTLPPPSKLREVEMASANKSETVDVQNGQQSEAGTPLPEPRNQKLLVVESLLLIGDIPDALFMIGKFPWILDLQPTIHKYIHRILHQSISELYLLTKPLVERGASLISQKAITRDQSGPIKGQLRTTQREPRRVLRWGKLDEYDATRESDFKFYWDDWLDNVPICRSVDDFFTLCSTFLGLTGLRLGGDAELLGKIARIGSHSILNDDSEHNRSRWTDLCKRLLVPALSFTQSNPGVVNQVWELLRTFPISVRYAIYAEWSSGASSRTTAMKDARKLSEDQTKDVLKRISKENTREMAKALAKIAMSSPCVVFQHALNQVQSYSNLIAVVIECARYFTSMAYDVLTWSILAVLGNGGSATMQADGMLTSVWLRQLSVFTGDVCKRYSIMSPSPILCYVAQQLRDGRSDNLELLEQVITSMTGIKTELSYNQQQLQYLMGGPIVREIVLKQLQDKRFDSRTSSRRLLKALQDSHLLVPILLLLAQERQQYIFRADVDNAPLKVLGSNQDKIHGAFMQYLETLRYSLSEQDFGAAIPDLPRLMSDFGLQAPIAFLVAREVTREKLNAYREAVKASKIEMVPVVAEIEMIDAVKAPELAQETATDSVEITNEDTAATAIIAQDKTLAAAELAVDSPAGETTESAMRAATPATMHPVIESLAEQLRAVLRPDFEEAMSIQFYTWFWQLSAYDIHYPKDTYNTEQEQVKAKMTKLAADRRDVSQAATVRKEAEKKRLVEVQQGLINETRLQMLQNTVVKRELRKEKDLWFQHLPLESFRQLSENIIQDCIMPRALLSPQDAYYTAKFIFLVHGLGPVAFRTILIIDCIFRVNFLEQVIFVCTAREAENFGWFLNELLVQLHRWHTKVNKNDKNPEELYSQEAFGSKKTLPGFCSKIKPDLIPDSPLSWEDYRRILFKWHGLIMKALQHCLSSTEYMHIRNAIVVLKTIHTQFPRITFQGDKLTQAITEISRSDDRQDLKLSALSLLGDLKKKQKEWILPQAFRNAADPTVSKAQTNATTVATLTQPVMQDESDKKAASAEGSTTELNPTVPEFKPAPDSEITNNTKPSGEHEDGEVDDKAAAKATAKVDATANADASAQAPASEAQVAQRQLPQLPERPVAPTQSSRNDDVRARSRRITPPPERRDNRDDLVPRRTQPTMPHRADLPKRPEGAIPRLDRNAHLPKPPEKSRGGSRRSSPPREGLHSRQAGAATGAGTSDNSAFANGPGRGAPAVTSAAAGHETFQRSLNSRPSQGDQRPDSHHSRQEANAPRDRGFDMSRTGPESTRRSHAHTSATEQAVKLRNTQAPVEQPSINPARAALISASTHDEARNVTLEPQGRRGDRQSDKDARNSARNDVSRRREGDLGPTNEAMNGRAPSSITADQIRDHDRAGRMLNDRSIDRRDDNRYPPGGPRGERPVRHDAMSTERPRDLFQHAANSRPPLESSHGRLSMGGVPPSRPVQDQNYGRLNATADVALSSSPPSGPRGRSGRAVSGRNFTAPIPSAPGQQQQSAPAEPATVGAVQESRGIRRPLPDDRQARVDSTNYAAPSQSASAPIVGDIHPSRLGQLQINPSQTPHQPFADSPNLPAGPRSRQAGNVPSHQLPSPVHPSQPTINSDRRGPRMLASVNTLLQQAGDSTNGHRGRSGRNSSSVQDNAPRTSEPVQSQYADIDRSRDGPSERRDVRPGLSSERQGSFVSPIESRLGSLSGNDGRGSLRQAPQGQTTDRNVRPRSPRRERDANRPRVDYPHLPVRDANQLQRHDEVTHRGPTHDFNGPGGRDTRSNDYRPPNEPMKERPSRRDKPPPVQRNNEPPQVGDMSASTGSAQPYDQPAPSRKPGDRHSHQDDAFGQRGGFSSRNSGAGPRNIEHDGRGPRGGDRRSDGRKRRGNADDGSSHGESKRPRR